MGFHSGIALKLDVVGQQDKDWGSVVQGKIQHEKITEQKDFNSKP